MVKADAYNHGLEGVIHISRDVIDRYGVATLNEAIKLRQLGVAKPITLFSFETKDIKEIVAYNITPVVYNNATLESVIKERYTNFDLKIDSGMNRFGFKDSAKINEVFTTLIDKKQLPHAIHTHFYSRESISAQLNRFNSLLQPYERELLYSKKIVSASLGIDNGIYLDGVRLGLSAYRGALEITSDILLIKEVNAFESVGYDGDFVPEKTTRIALVSGGYYDGIRRAYKGAKVLLNGHEATIVGKVCMDTTIIDIGNIPATTLDKVILIDSSTIGSYIQIDNSSEYEVITAIKGRGKRIYLYNGQKYDKSINKKSYLYE